MKILVQVTVVDSDPDGNYPGLFPPQATRIDHVDVHVPRGVPAGVYRLELDVPVVVSVACDVQIALDLDEPCPCGVGLTRRQCTFHGAPP